MTIAFDNPSRPLVAQLDQESALAVITDGVAAYDLVLELFAGGSPISILALRDLTLVGSEVANRALASPGSPFWTTWFVKDGGAARPCDANILPEWTLAGSGTAYLHSHASEDEIVRRAIYRCPVEGERLTATPGELYSFSILAGLHRTKGRIVLSFFGAQGLIEAQETEIPQGFEGGRQIDNYVRISASAVAPVGTTNLSIELIKEPTCEGKDSFLFFTRPRLWRGGGAPVLQPMELPFEFVVALFVRPDVELRLIPLTWTSDSRAFSELEVTDRATGRRLAKFDFVPAPGPPFELQVLGLEGTSVLMRVTRVASWLLDVKLVVSVDQRSASEASFRSPCVGDVLRIPLPIEFLDARAHLIQVKLAEGGRLLGECVEFIPDSLLSWGDLIRNRAVPDTVVRTPAIEHRYRALTSAMRQLVRQRSTANNSDPDLQIREIAQAHEVVAAGFDLPRRDYPVLHFAVAPNPRISIVIPVHDKFPVTFNCLAAIILAGFPVSTEIIVVDDGSTDLTLDLPNFAPQVVYVRSEAAEGFVGACGRGAAIARGEFIVFLNNDTEPTVGWLDELLFAFDEFDDVGLAGSMLVYPDGRLQDAGGIVWCTGDPWNYGRGGNPRDPKYIYAREVDYLSGACIMIPRAIWKEVEGFSPEFSPAYFEDTDLAFKVRKLGRRVVFVPTSLVYHYEGLSNGTDVFVATGLKRFQEINRPKFKARWFDEYRHNGQLGEDVDLEKDRCVAGRVVFFDIDVPKPDESAGGYASFQEIRLFQSLGYKVTFLPITLNYLGRYTEQLQRAGVEVVYAPHFSNVEQFIQRRGREFDLAYITRYQVADRVADSFRAVAPNTPLICNVADLHFLRAFRKAVLGDAQPGDMNAVAELRGVELSALHKVDLALTYSGVEESVLDSHLLGSTKVARLPWVLDLACDVAPIAQRTGIGFVGGFGHAPNVAAVEFFVQEVMPRLRLRLPGVRFHVYGSNMPPELLALGTDDVVFEGFVRELGEVFDQRRVFVAPLTYGAGVKGKVLDCAAAGVPGVLSLIAAEGLPIRDGIEALVANSPEVWVDSIVALCLDDELWQSMSCAARVMARNYFSFERGRNVLSDALRLVGISAAGNRAALHVVRSRPQFPQAELTY